MSSSNFVRIGGRLCRDPEIKYTSTGKAICNFSLAFNHSQDKTSFFDCVAWEKTGIMISEKKKKGDYLKVSGTLQQEKWQGKDGQNHSKIKITVTEIIITFLEKKENSQYQPQNQAQGLNSPQYQQNTTAQQNAQAVNDTFGNDVPF